MTTAEMIRKAQKRDISRIAEILIFTKRMNYRPIFCNDQVSFGEMQVLPLIEEFQKDIAKLNNYWVYEDGFVKGLIHMEKKEIKELYVEPFFHGQEIGGKLIDFAIENGAALLWVLEKNLRAIAFYQRHGFICSGKRKLEDGTTEYLVQMTRGE